MDVELIIARYNEDLNWITDVPNNIKITIYNKGKNNLPFKSIKIPNVGRESNTYLHHIIKNYDNLSQTTIFCQGNPFDHCPNFLKILKYTHKFEKIQPLNSTIDINKNIRNLSHIKLNKFNIHIDYVNNDFIPCYPTYWYNHDFENYIKYIKKLYSIKNIYKYYSKKLNIKYFDSNYLIPVNYAAMFSVNKNIIKKNNINFYKNMNNILLNTKEFDLGYIYERLWMVIFYFHKYNSNFEKLNLKKYELKKKSIIIKNNLKLNIPFKYNWFIIIILNNKETYELGIYKKTIHIKIKKSKKIIKLKNEIKNKFILDIKKNKSEFIIHNELISLPKNTFITKITFHDFQEYLYDTIN